MPGEVYNSVIIVDQSVPNLDLYTLPAPPAHSASETAAGESNESRLQRLLTEQNANRPHSESQSGASVGGNMIPHIPSGGSSMSQFFGDMVSAVIQSIPDAFS